MAILIIVLILIPVIFIGLIILNLANMINRFINDVETIEVIYEILFGNEENEEKYKNKPMPINLGEWHPTFKDFSWAVDYLADYIRTTIDLYDVLEKVVDEDEIGKYKDSLMDINAKVRYWKWQNGEPEFKVKSEEENR